jgi:hypothetical protein
MAKLAAETQHDHVMFAQSDHVCGTDGRDRERVRARRASGVYRWRGESGVSVGPGL